MLRLAAYADRLSARPGEVLNFHLSNATGARVAAEIVRVHSADPNPAGPGVQTSPVTALPPIEAGAHPVDRGSFAVVDLGERLSRLDSFTLSATVWPTRLGHLAQPIVAWLDPATGTGVSFEIGVDGRLTAVAGLGGGKTVRVDGGPILREREWGRVRCAYDAGTRSLTVSIDGRPASAASRVLPSPIARSTATKLCIGASPAASFNGKIEHPRLYDRAGIGVEAPLAHWDFSQDMSSTRVVDVGPHGLHGVLVNRPTRAMTGSTWTGREMCWRYAPDQYAAVHFHEDDIDDCRWPVALAWTVPADLTSGCYALVLKAGDATENVPFFVVPPKGRAAAKIAVLVSTYTYTIYANHTRPEWLTDATWRNAWLGQAKAWGGYPDNPGDHPEYGYSTYNFHTDGSGIAYSTWHRPMLNVRIGYITYPYPEIRGSGLRHYPADMHLVSWLEAKGYAFDVITDAELDREGAAVLAPYTVLMTGSHPEYHTPAMLDALEAYRDGGGRLMYLGGNGFYWKVACDPEKDGVIEIRRAEGGIRAWAAEVGEYYNAFDGEYGGLWRRNGRPPQKLVGVGFTAQGNFVGSHYRVKPDARASRAGWILDGVAGDVIGDFGLSGHGAAGFELDRAEKRLGTPPHALIIAASEGHKPEAPWVLVPEEQLSHITTWAGEPAATLIRADMTFFETPNGGAVFSTGSITFCGSLPHNGFDNPVSRLLGNVLAGFLDPARTFDVPVG